ncbi:Predicted lysozyme (DUF847) [Leclercia adecarboxylata]|uniref:Predicted lysozyme (DUF847) n=1 Tax=Leclercia adecarboxylata TaxID=83655 RepID=A0A4V6JIX0_9ENTR|nr:Predicted lysozyme (DUF847) [Leclercia adecarboxylata]
MTPFIMLQLHAVVALVTGILIAGYNRGQSRHKWYYSTLAYFLALAFLSIPIRIMGGQLPRHRPFRAGGQHRLYGGDDHLPREYHRQKESGVTKDDIFNGILGKEGGYVNHPNDKGGPTNWGVTQATARAHGYTGDMRNLTREQALAILEADYWYGPRFDQVASVLPGYCCRTLRYRGEHGAIGTG